MKTIRVTGKGRVKLRPDVTRITMTLEGVRSDYGEALKKSSEDTESLKELLAGFGFERTDLKTLSFNVDTEYEGYEEQGVYKQRLVGYRFRHLLKVEFTSDNELLGKIVYALAKSSVSPEFRIGYTVSDPEKARNELLEKAVSDANEKAAALSRAAGVSLLGICRIDYSLDENSFEISPVNRMAQADGCMLKSAASGSYSMDIEPDDIEVSDTVTVIWEIG